MKPYYGITYAILLSGCAVPSARQAASGYNEAIAQPKAVQRMLSLEEFVARHKASKDPEVQDTVTKASIRLAFEKAESKNIAAARVILKKAAEDYKGTGRMDPAFGSLDEQALYQSIVCLTSEGRKGLAIHEFTRFLKNKPLSPLVFAVYRRLARLDPPGKERYLALLEEAKARQEEHGRWAMARCGPLAAQKLLQLKGIQPLT